MRTFLAKVSVFNGRFYRHRQFTVQASSFTSANRKAQGCYRELVPPRSNVEQVVVSVTAIKGCRPIVEEEPENKS